MNTVWHSKTAEETLRFFRVSHDRGLSEDHVQEQQAIFGKNIFEKKWRFRLLNLFLNQLSSPLVVILLIAASVTFFMLGDTPDTIIIGLAVFINTVMGVIQEGRASRAFDALRQSMQRTARVLRGGVLREIPSSELVPGDIIDLDAGMGIDADSRLIDANNFKTNEALLTGEWIAQEKNVVPLSLHTPVADRANMVYAGTLSESGRARAVVVAIGAETEIGKIAASLADVREVETPLQKHLSSISQFMGTLVLGVAIVLFLFGIARGESLETMFLIAVALAVSAVPEGLPVAVSVILALGMERILKKGGLVKNMKSAETLGSTSVILTDKTGTLTTGEMAVAHVLPTRENKEAKVALLTSAVLTSGAFIENPNDELSEWHIVGESTDRALLLAGVSGGIVREDYEAGHELIRFYPFDTERRLSAALFKTRNKNEYNFFVTGAPEIILGMSRLSAREKKRLEELYQYHTERGVRMIASACRRFTIKPEKLDDACQKTDFLGFIGLHDPLREDVKYQLHLAEAAGMRPVIVTGDHRLTAERIAKELDFDGNPDRIADGEQFEKGGIDVEHIDIFARVLPHQKQLIAEAWQKKGAVVAMTGDGVNDAPALKRADIGIALGSGTEVAKEAADLVLIDNSFKTIVSAIEEGRVIVDNIRKVVTFLFATAFTEIILVAGAFALGLPLPILPAQILWMNLVGEGFFNFAFAFEKRESDVLAERPQKRRELFTREMKILIVAAGILSDILLLGTFVCLLGLGVQLEVVRTVMFYGLAVSAFFFVFSLRSLRRPLWKIDFFSNPYLLFAFGASLSLLLPTFFAEPLKALLHLTSVSLPLLGLVLILGIVDLALIECVKYFLIVRHKRQAHEALLH